MQPQRQLRGAAPHQAEAGPKHRKASGPPPPSINDCMLGGEEGGCHWNAQSRLDQAAPCRLLHRSHDAGECQELKRQRIRRWPVRLMAEKRAAQRVPGESQRETDQQGQRTTISAGPRSAIAQRGCAEKRIGDQPGARARSQEPPRDRLPRRDGGCPQKRLQLGRVSERRWAGVPLGGAPSGGLVKRPKSVTCLRTPVPHSEPP
jgi:hypothetical protein